MEDEPLDFSNPLIQRHKVALEVLRACDTEHAPLAIYLRNFGVHVMHGPSEPERQFGEESVLDALPESARLMTIQEEPKGELS